MQTVFNVLFHCLAQNVTPACGKKQDACETQNVRVYHIYAVSALESLVPNPVCTL